jgi:hypothetical protein
MKLERKMTCLVVPFLFGCQSTVIEHLADRTVTPSQQTAQATDPLKLQLELTQVTSDKLEMVAVLTNNSGHDIPTSVNPNPLTLLIWSKDDHNLTHRITKRVKCKYEQGNVSGADGPVVIHVEVDLSKYQHSIKASEDIFVSAQYGQLGWYEDGSMTPLVYSNRVYLDQD